MLDSEPLRLKTGWAALKRVAEWRREKVMPVRLYMDDVEAIHSHVEELSDDVKIKAPGFEFETPADLADHPSQPLRELELYCWSPYFRVAFHEFGVSMSFEDTPLPIGISVKIKDILNDRRRPFASISLTGWFALLNVMLGIAIVTNLVRGGRLAWVVAIPVIMLSCWNLFSFFIVFRGRGFNLIYTSYLKDRPGFLTRNRDALIVGAILGLLTVIASVVATKLFD